MKLQTCIIVIFLFFSCKKVNQDCNTEAYPNAPAQAWFTSYNGSGEESHGHYILTCSDGGFLQVGETGFIPNSAKILVVKTNSSGNLEWKKELSNAGHNLGNAALETEDGFLICGAINENSALIKLNKDGEVIFEKIYDNGGSDAFEHIALLPDGIAAVGYVQAEDNQNTFFTEGQGYLTILNEIGEKQSEKNLSDYLAQAYRIQVHNNEWIISGLTEGAEDYALLKTDEQGEVIWNKKYGGSDADHCFGMDLGEDGSIFLTGHTLSGTENWDTYTTKIDINGNKIWEATQGNPRGFDPKYIHDEAWDIKATDDGGCILVAGTGDEYSRYERQCGDGDSSGTWHVYLVKYDADGAVEWQKTYGGDEADWAGEAIDLTPAGAAIIGVDNGAFGFLKINKFL